MLLGAGLAAGSVAGAGNVGAASPIPTAFVNVTVSPDYITYGHTTLTVTGRLVESADHNAGVPAEFVDINSVSTGITIGTATTDSTGRFSVTESTLVWADELVAVTAGDATYGGATSARVEVSVIVAPTRITLNKQAQLVAPAGTARTFTGKAQVEVNGKWIPLPGAYVQVAQNDGLTLPANGPIGTTSSNGTFSLRAEAISSGGHWFANTTWVYPSPTTSQPLYSQVNSNVVDAYVSYRTRITRFSIPARAQTHRGLDINGAMQLWNGSKWDGPDAVADPTIWMRRLPGGRWTPVMQMQAGPSGGSVLTFAQDGLFLYYAVFNASAPVYLVTTVVDNTCVTGLTVGHADGRTQVGGEVQDSCGPGEASFGPVRGTFDVYFHPRGTTKWRLLGSARTGSGSLSFTRAGTLNGYFKVVFPAQWYYLGSTSKSVYVG